MDIAAIRAVLEARLCPQASTRDDCICTVHAHGGWRPYSQIFHAACSHFPYELLVKRCLDASSGSIDAKSARMQFHGMEQAWLRSGRGASYSVPQPVLLLEEEGILITEWVKAPSLTQRLCAWSASASELSRLVASAARWLRWFHESEDLPPVGLESDELVARLVEGDVDVVRDPAFQAGCRLLQVTGAGISGIRTARARLHGDYKADNILVDGERTVAIDLQPEHCNSVLFDVASFLNHLELLAWHPKAWQVALRRVHLVRCFLNNYFDDPVDDRLYATLQWVRLFNVLGAWLDAAPEIPSRWRRRYAHFCYRRVVYALINELRQAARP